MTAPRKDPTAHTPELKAARRQRRKDAREIVKQGRPVGSRADRPRAKRVLTPVQKLREHVLIELGVDKKDIADAIGGVTRQSVSHVFLDVHRSPEIERKTVAFLRKR